MNIAVNAWILRKKELDGIGTVTVEAIRRIIAAHPEVTFLMLCDKGFTEDYFDFPNTQIHRIFPPFRHPLLYIFYLEIVLPLFLKKHRPDLLLSPDGLLSLNTFTPQVGIIHDLNFIHQPRDLDLKNRLYYQRFFPRFARKAARIATVSEYSKADVSKTLSIAPQNIDVIYCGVKESIRPSSKAVQEATRRRFAHGRPYFFFAGTLHPRKNIVRLLQAFDKFRYESDKGVELVIAGSFMWDASEIKEAYEALRCKEAIMLTGRVSEEELSALYGAALALVFVPTFEGFGLPIIESFAAETPVMTSNTTSMPEVAGGAALLVNPFSIDDITTGMHRLANNEENLLQNMIEKGKRQKQKFSWEQTASRLWDCCINALVHPPAK